MDDQRQPGEWTNDELFNSLKAAYIIAPEEMYEDWENDRERMIELIEEDIKRE